MIHPLCGFSFGMGAIFIANFDLLLYLLSLLIILGADFDAGNHKYGRMEDMMEIKLNEDHFNLSKNGTKDESEFRVFDRFVSFDVYTKLAETIMFIFWALCILEMWMFVLLLKASMDRNAGACRLWLWLRATLFVLFLTLLVLGHATVYSNWSWMDWVFLLYATFSIWAFIVVNEFRKEVKASCPFVKLRDEMCDEVYTEIEDC